MIISVVIQNFTRMIVILVLSHIYMYIFILAYILNFDFWMSTPFHISENS